MLFNSQGFLLLFLPVVLGLATGSDSGPPMGWRRGAGALAAGRVSKLSVGARTGAGGGGGGP